MTTERHHSGEREEQNRIRSASIIPTPGGEIIHTPGGRLITREGREISETGLIERMMQSEDLDRMQVQTAIGLVATANRVITEMVPDYQEELSKIENPVDRLSVMINNAGNFIKSAADIQIEFEERKTRIAVQNTSQALANQATQLAERGSRIDWFRAPSEIKDPARELMEHIADIGGQVAAVKMFSSLTPEEVETAVNNMSSISEAIAQHKTQELMVPIQVDHERNMMKISLTDQKDRSRIDRQLVEERTRLAMAREHNRASKEITREHLGALAEKPVEVIVNSAHIITSFLIDEQEGLVNVRIPRGVRSFVNNVADNQGETIGALSGATLGVAAEIVAINNIPFVAELAANPDYRVAMIVPSIVIGSSVGYKVVQEAKNKVQSIRNRNSN